jgi:DNA processing protein
MQIHSILSQDDTFPTQLREISSSPKELFVLGELPTRPAIAIVGSRKPTAYGKEVTYQLAFELARAGIVIISGLALGLDTIAHQAALDAGGQTVAVLAHGLDQIYPSSNRNLALDILKHRGALVSDYPVKTPSLPQHFAARNRIISGLSLGTIVTEAASSSGSLITANFALDQNRVVMAVPGNITSLASAGPNNLLRAGAVPVTSASDVLAAIGFESSEEVTAQPPRPIARRRPSLSSYSARASAVARSSSSNRSYPRASLPRLLA